MNEDNDGRISFENALARIGFAAQEHEAFMNQSGRTNIAMLRLSPSDQENKIYKPLITCVTNPIIIAAIQEQLLHAMRFWVSNLQRLKQPINLELFTTVMALNQAQTIHQYLEDGARTDREQAAKAPDKFKNANGWKIFAEALKTYLSQLYGSGRVPLGYVIQQEVVAVPNAAYDTEQVRNIALTPLNGSSYQRDNARVYGIIKQLVLEGPGRTFILLFDSVADGCSAWLALKAHYEGEGFQNQNIEDAYAMLDRLTYKGKRKGFTFEKFIERHMECQLELEKFDEPILETKKVRDLLTRIKAIKLAAAKQQVRATPQLFHSFEEAINFLSLSVVPLKVANHQVAALGTGSRDNQCQNFQGLLSRL